MTQAPERKSTRIKVVVEHCEDGYVAYPLSMKGVIVGQGDSFDEALADVSSAIHAHVEQFGSESLTKENLVVEAFIAEAEVVL
jgi:predicted RNase H-like HicB family nuclease